MAVKAYLLRQYFKDHTTGVFTAIDDAGNLLFSCCVLELPWKDNQRKISCIPEGEFVVHRRWTKRFKWHYHIEEVPDRTYILQHPGNYTSDIEGCQLPGEKFANLNGDKIPDILNTRATLDKMLVKLGNEYTLFIGTFIPPTHDFKVLPSHYSTIPPATPLP